MKEVVIYTDGACSGNPGPGGWAAVLLYNDNRSEISGYEESTTNNIMEMTAVIEGLKQLKVRCRVKLYTDSKYIVDSITKWIHGWVRNGWKTASKKPVKNKELWETLMSLTKSHEIEWNWVKGHEGNELNERCDILARGKILENKIIREG